MPQQVDFRKKFRGRKLRVDSGQRLVVRCPLWKLITNQLVCKYSRFCADVFYGRPLTIMVKIALS